MAHTHTHVHAILLCCLDFCFFHADSSIAEPVGIFLSLSIALVLHRPGRETQKERTTSVQRHTVSRSVCGGLLLFSLRFQRGQRARARTHSLLMVCGSTSLHLFHPARLFFVLCRMYVCLCVCRLCAMKGLRFKTSQKCLPVTSVVGLLQHAVQIH